MSIVVSPDQCQRFHAAWGVLLPSIPGFQILLFVLSIQAGTTALSVKFVFTAHQHTRQTTGFIPLVSWCCKNKCLWKEHKTEIKTNLKLQSITFGTALVLQKNIVAGATSLGLCLWRITQVPHYSAAVPTRTSLNSLNINTYYRCTVVIQDKLKHGLERFHGVLAYYTFWTKKSLDCSFKIWGT